MIASLKKRYMDFPIRSKLVVWICLSVALTFAVILCITCVYFSRDLREKAVSSTFDLVLYENALVQSEQQYLYGVAAYYATNREVQNLMRASNAGDGDLQAALSGDLYSVSLARLHILSFSFYDRNGRALVYRSIDQSHGVRDQNPEDADSPLGELFRGRYTYLWGYIPQGDTRLAAQDNSPKICLWYLVRDNTSYAPIGALCITLDTRKLLRTDHSFDQTYYSHMFIADNKGNMVIERGESAALTQAELARLREQANPYIKTGVFTTRLRGKEVNVIYSRISETNGYTTFAILSDPVSFWSTLTFWLCCLTGLGLALLLALPVTYFFSTTLSRPLNSLLRSMSAFRDGNRNAHASLYCQDEIGKLGAMFNEIVAENNRLIEDTYLLTIRRQAAELTALSVQINPHFSYNMLNMIQWTALENGNEEVADIAYCTGQIFHLLLNHGSQFFTLSQERTLLHYYLRMQQKRFHDRVQFEMDFAPEALEVTVPKLIIQPLVENSILHGVDNAHPHIRIEVRVRRADGRVRIVVTDDGIGIPPDMLALLPEGAHAREALSTGSRYAVRNIAERLRLFYGEGAYQFLFNSAPGAGTVITIDIPDRLNADFLTEEENADAQTDRG